MTNLPAHLLSGDRRQLGQQSIEGLSAPPVPYISIEGQKFTLVDATGATMELPTYGPIFTQKDQSGADVAVQGSPTGIYLDAILVDVNQNMSKVYYAQAYGGAAAGSFVPPDCWSDNGVAPSASANRPQAEHCQTCRWNEWGSKVNALGSKVKACDDVKKLAFIVPSFNNGQAFIFRLKGSSHRNWSSYVETLGKYKLGDRPLDPVDVVTRIYFEPGQIGIIKFHSIRLITAQEAAIEDTIWKARSTDSMVGRLDRPRTGALPAPAAAPPLAAPPAPAVAPPPPQPPSPPAPSFAQPQQAAPAQAPVFGQQPPPPPNTGQQQPAPQGTPAPPKRQRRQVAAPAQQPATADPVQPSFAMPQTPPPAPPAQQPMSPPPPPNFGIAQPGDVPSDLAAALDAALAPLPPA